MPSLVESSLIRQRPRKAKISVGVILWRTRTSLGQGLDMAHIEASINQVAATLERQYPGMWWTPSAPERRVPGTLRIDLAGQAKLEVTGELMNVEALSSDGVVLGDVFDPQGGVTICGAAVTNQRRRGETTVQEVVGTDILVGRQFPEGGLTRFTAVTFESSRLASWTNEPQPDLNNPTGDPLLYQVSIRVPEPLRCEIRDLGALTMNWLESSSFGIRGASVSVRPVFTVKLDGPLTLEEIWERVVTPLLFFTTFATGQGDSILSLKLQSSANARPDDWYDGDKAEWLGGTWGARSGDDELDVPRWEQLVQFDDVRDRFEQVFPRWFDLFPQAQSSLLDLFAVPITRGLFVEEQFTRIVRAMEAWHRETVGGTFMEDAHFADLLGRLVAAAESSEERSFVKMRLNYANERTLKQRLDALIEAAGSPLNDLVSSYSRFSRRVTDTRNSLAHHGSLGTAFDDAGLLCAQKTLELIMRAVLMRRLDFDDEAVAAAVQRTRDWTWWLGTPDNPLLA
jgi:hypothetical protein